MNANIHTSRLDKSDMILICYKFLWNGKHPLKFKLNKIQVATQESILVQDVNSHHAKQTSFTLYFGSWTVTPSTDTVSSTLGGFCPSAFFTCLLNFILRMASRTTSVPLGSCTSTCPRNWSERGASQLFKGYFELLAQFLTVWTVAMICIA